MFDLRYTRSANEKSRLRSAFSVGGEDSIKAENRSAFVGAERFLFALCE